MKQSVRSSPWLSVWRRLRRLPGDERGASAIEFVLASLPVFFLLIATIEFALDMTVDVTVQIAAQAASRAGLAMSPPATGVTDTRAKQAQTIVDQYLGAWEHAGAKVTVTQLDYVAFSNFGVSGYKAALVPGNCGDVEMYNIELTMPSFTGLAKWFGMPTLNFQRNYIVQNEECTS